MVFTKRQENIIRNLTDEQKEIINEYHADRMYKLRKICDPLIYRKNVPSLYHDELYVVASNTLLESLDSYDASKETQFKTYLTGNIQRAFYDWTRDSRRGKRCNVERDRRGRIIRDKKKNPIVISDVSLDEPTEEGIDLIEKVASAFSIEDNLSHEVGGSSSDKWEKYLAKLSNKQRKVALLLSEGYRPHEIRDILHISDKEYADHLSGIKSYENLLILV